MPKECLNLTEITGSYFFPLFHWLVCFLASQVQAQKPAFSLRPTPDDLEKNCNSNWWEDWGDQRTNSSLYSSAILCLALSGVMLQELHITVMLSKQSNRAAEASKEKALHCSECSISVAREEKLYCVHLDKFLSPISNYLITLYQCIFEIDWGRGEVSGVWGPLHLTIKINLLQQGTTCSADMQLLKIRFGEHPNSFKVPGDFRKLTQTEGPPVDLKLSYLQSFFNKSWYPRPQPHVSGRRFCLLQQKFAAQPDYIIWRDKEREEKPGTLIILNSGCFRKLAITYN